MEILESISWVSLGFVPTLALFEISDRLRRGRKKEVVAGTPKVPTLVTG
jgi:hypothetical protein